MSSTFTQVRDAIIDKRIALMTPPKELEKGMRDFTSLYTEMRAPGSDDSRDLFQLLKEADCLMNCLEDCEAVALTNCGFFLHPVAAISGEKIGELNYDVVHPAFKRLVEALVNEPGVII